MCAFSNEVMGQKTEGAEWIGGDGGDDGALKGTTNYVLNCHSTHPSLSLYIYILYYILYIYISIFIYILYNDLIDIMRIVFGL